MCILNPSRAGWPLAAACIPLILSDAASAQAAAEPQTVVVTGNPLGRDTVAQPTQVLAGDGLTQRRAGTLGETLAGLPGVSATAFGPNSSRPVIRGLDGDRLRLLDNGGASIDASSLSFDHASATDPLVAERIEVLRGPAALLYGGNAVGGVVNQVDNRIPRFAPQGLTGRGELRLGGASAERSGAAVVEGGAQQWAWHADVHARDAGDQRVPRFTPMEDGQPLPPSTRVRNSAARSQGAALGAAWVQGDDHAGAAVDRSEQHYGITAEPDVRIRLQRSRLALSGQRTLRQGPFNQLTTQASHTRYEHEEVEGDGTVGTTFRSSGQEARVQARQRPLSWAGGEVQGVWGVQLEQLRFSALGEEAFVPNTHTRSQAVFALQEWRQGPLSLSAGGRLESVRVASEGDADPQTTTRFGAADSRRFQPRSSAFTLRWGAPAGWQWSGTLAWTQRAPTYYELYAQGLHLATGAYERGDAQLSVERSRHAEVGLAWKCADAGFSVQLFRTDFARYLSLDATGQQVQVPGEPGNPPTDVPEYRFRAVQARLSGGELEGHARVWQGTGWGLDLRGSADTVRGTDLTNEQALPRLAPWRAQLGLALKADGWQAGATWRRHGAQTRVPNTDEPTPGFTMLDLWASLQGAGAGAPQLLVKLGNATNRLATNASSIATIRGLSPLPGRALSVVLRAAF